MHQKIQCITSLPLSLSVLFFKNCCLHWCFLCWYRSYATSAGKSGYFSLFVCLCVDTAKNVLGTSSGGSTWKYQSSVQKTDSSFCLCELELLFPCSGRGNLVGKSVQEEMLESRTPSVQAGLPPDRVTELLTTRVQRAYGMIIFFTPPWHPATSNCSFYGREEKLIKR